MQGVLVLPEIEGGKLADAERMQRSRRYAALVVALAASLGAGYLIVLETPALRQFFDLLDRWDL